MPLSLDLTKTYPTADMILSSRNPPRMSLRRAGSYNGSDRGPLSSTSSRFSFNHLIATPPPSPSLPALIPRHGRSLPANPRRYVRALLWLVGVVVITYYGLSRIRTGHTGLVKVGWENHAGEQFEMVGDEELPDFPTPVVVTDKRGRAKWTVSIPPHSQFPLKPSDYLEICQQNMEVAIHVADLHSHSHKIQAAHYDYYHVDLNFMDVAEAEAHGLLPGPKAKTSMKEVGLVGEVQDSLIDSDVCKKSMTFLMETGDAGLGNTLMMLWTAYGLAQKEGRDFFIDDSRWAYGKYTNYFSPPPIPRCRPPPRHEMLPCPHHARHLIVSAATAASTFGGAFNEQFEDPRKMEVYRQKPMFDMARAGYKALFLLANDDAVYVRNRITDMRKKAEAPGSGTENGMILGVHIRHGDRRPYEFQYRDSYIPLTTYSDKARDIILATYNNSDQSRGNAPVGEMHSLTVVASDDPDVYDSDEFSKAWRAQELIRLASHTTSTPPAKASPVAAIRKFIDESVGWEGGFFAGMFWSLGKPSSVPPTAMESSGAGLSPTGEALRLRELLGRAYLMDLAVIGESDKVVCTVSSMGCKILAVMMGWEKAIVKAGWNNIDGDFEWRGVSWHR